MTFLAPLQMTSAARVEARVEGKETPLFEGKYVMSSSGVILFPDTFNHSDFRFANPTSAGRFSILSDDGDDISVCVYGDSATLALEPDKDDAVKIKCFFDVVFASQREAESPDNHAQHV